MAGPLKGIRIIEMEGIGPGPFCGMMLADMGAEVLRIARKQASPAKVLTDKYDVLGRSRRVVTLDLKAEGAVEAVLKLGEVADGLIEGYRPSVMERLGLGPDVMQARNPKLIYGRMTGWGQEGPLSRAAGHDINYISLTGALYSIGTRDKPIAPLNLVGDFGGGAMYLAFGMVCGLLEAKSSGQGQIVDAAMIDGSASLMAMMYGMQARGLWTDARESNLLDGAAHFYDTYRCADGKHVSIGSIEPQFYALLLEKAGITDPDFQNQMSPPDWPVLKEKLAAIFAIRARDEWCEIMECTDICFAPVLSMSEAPNHPHNAARGTFVDIDGVTQPAPAPRFSRTVSNAPQSAAAPGTTDRQVLADWGLGDAVIGSLEAEGVI